MNDHLIQSDTKGRLNLGIQFASCQFLIEEIDEEQDEELRIMINEHDDSSIQAYANITKLELIKEEELG